MDFTREGWYQHSCGHEEFYWPGQWFPSKCRRCHKTNLRWAWVPGYVFQDQEADSSLDIRALRDMHYRNMLEWLIKRDKELAAELYDALTEGRIR